jgi:hypothetical protein
MFVATGLPAWATFNISTGVLGGTPPSTTSPRWRSSRSL